MRYMSYSLANSQTHAHVVQRAICKNLGMIALHRCKLYQIMELTFWPSRCEHRSCSVLYLLYFFKKPESHTVIIFHVFSRFYCSFCLTFEANIIVDFEFVEASHKSRKIPTPILFHAAMQVCCLSSEELFLDCLYCYHVPICMS